MRIWIILFSLSAILAGCGVYSFKGQAVGGVKTISVEPFENQTTEFGLREQLLDAIVSKLLTEKVLTIASARTADAMLTGVVVSVSDQPLTFRADESVTEYKVVLVIDVKLQQANKPEPLWSGRLSGEGNYPYSGGSTEERRKGLQLAVEKVVQDLLNKLTSDW
jgi:outer membrane lipopolysaccharide assembly protein LptE/RlpB